MGTVGDLPYSTPSFYFCQRWRFALCLSPLLFFCLLLPSRPHWLTSERARGKRDGRHHDRLFMLTTGLRITPLRNEDKYAPAFLLAALPFFFLLPLCQLLLFSIISSLWCVPAIKCVYVCTCVTQIAVDGFNQMAAPFCCSQLFSPSFGSSPSGICVAPTRENGPQERTFRQKCCIKGKKKGKKKRTGPHKGGYSPGLTSGQMQRFGSHTSLSVVSSAIFLCTIFKKKCTQINKKKKRFTNAKLQKKKIFLGRGSICIL